MKATTTCMVLAIFLLAGSASATEIPAGPVSGDWYSSGNPYNINGEIYVDYGMTLNIHEGVEVIFQGYYNFPVYGSLQAIGSESDSILFTAADTSLGWGSFSFQYSITGNLFSYCIIQYGHVLLGNGSVGAIDHSTLRWNHAGFSGGAIACWEGSILTLESCLITENESWGDGGGLSLYEASYLSMNNCIISNNLIDNNGGGGGGVAFFFASGDISNCLFNGNEAHTNGGGALLFRDEECNMTVSNCTFTDNSTAGRGGAVYCYNYASASFFNCTFSENYSAIYGGGVDLYSAGNVSLEYCQVTDNTAVSLGGGVNINASSNTSIENCTIANNVSSNQWGGGISIYYSGAEIVNTIIEGNEGNGGIYFNTTEPVTITYCDISNNSPENLIGTTIPAGLGVLAGVNANGDSCDVFMNIFLDPLFYATSGDSAFYLSWDSPCVDAGDPASPLDPDSTITDIGALWPPVPPVSIESPKLWHKIEEYRLCCAHPNPFNPTTTIGFALPEDSRVHLAIYDVSGRQVAALVEGWRQAGNHEVTFDAGVLPSGVYLAKLEAGSHSAAQKLVVLK